MEHAPSPKFVGYRPARLSPAESATRAKDFFALMDGRRSVRHFSNEPVAMEMIDDLIRAASTAPSGAHKQPWTFCVVTAPALKHAIREAAEEEERTSYGGRMSPEWLEDLAPLGTDWRKEFLDVAPCLIVVFKRPYEVMPDGSKRKNYYVEESVGIACGFLLAAARNAGLVTLTHTPSPMGFLNELLERPDNEKPYILLVVGYPKDDCMIPNIRKKALSDIASFL